MRKVTFKTRVLVCTIILIGFLVNAWINYSSEKEISTDNIEHVSLLTSEGIYYRIKSIFSKPINISLTMANDSLLKSFLDEEEDNIDDEEYINTLQEYLDAYRQKYDYDSVFLVSTKTGRYYNFNGVNRVLTEDNPENEWYYNFLEAPEDYSLNIDNDEAAEDEITVFINCHIKNDVGNTIGVVGVGLKIESLQELLAEYEKEFDVKTYLIDKDGMIEISTSQTGYQGINLFDICNYQGLKNNILDNVSEEELLTEWVPESRENTYVVSQYIPELSWHLIVEHDNAEFIEQTDSQFIRIFMIAMFVVVAIMCIISYIIKRYDNELITLTVKSEREKSEAFRNATEQIYDNIYELNITKNCAGGKSTEQYFESLGISGKTPLNQALRVIAEKQMKEEYREGYLHLFDPENVTKEYEKGNTKFNYEFLMSEDGENYVWMSIIARAYYSPEDGSICMFTYRKNIDDEKRQELKMIKRAEVDAMTKIYNKTFTRKYINEAIENGRNNMYAFYIFDIDNFKKVNDKYGHAFGDIVINEFVANIKSYFNKDSDIIGRIGGDEFVVFSIVSGLCEAEAKAEDISKKLNFQCTNGDITCNISASIGVALSPNHGTDYDLLYSNADSALYKTKEKGKNGYSFFG